MSAKLSYFVYSMFLQDNLEARKTNYTFTLLNNCVINTSIDYNKLNFELFV